MTKADEQKMAMEIEFEKNQFINEVIMASNIMGVETDFWIKTDEAGTQTPYLKLKKITADTPERITELKKILQERRVEWMKTLKFKEAAIDEKPMIDEYIEKMKRSDNFEADFMEVLGVLERQYGMTMKPVIYASYDFIKGTYDIVPKAFPKADEKATEPESKETDTAKTE